MCPCSSPPPVLAGSVWGQQQAPGVCYELQYCNYVRYQKIDFTIEICSKRKGNKIHLMIIGYPLTPLFAPSPGGHQSGPAIIDDGRNV